MVLCRKCHNDKAPDGFFASKRALSGLQTYCKPCQLDYTKANPAAAEARRRKYLASKPAEATYRHLVRRANRLGVPFMEREVFCAWYYDQLRECIYCGDTQEQARAKYGHALHVDRKDGAKGYSAGNLCLACQRCNMVKSGYLTHQQMMEVAKKYFTNKDNGDE